jgi:hypothetical protein
MTSYTKFKDPEIHCLKFEDLNDNIWVQDRRSIFLVKKQDMLGANQGRDLDSSWLDRGHVKTPRRYESIAEHMLARKSRIMEQKSNG